MNSTYRARGWRVGEAAPVTICRAYARRSFSSFASRFGAARQVASAAPRFTPRNPAPTLAAHFLPSRLASARLGKSLRLRLASRLETPRLRSPLIFFLRVSLRRGSASRFGCASLHASKPRAYARRSWSSFASRFGAARQVASAAPRLTPRNPAPTLAAQPRPRARPLLRALAP